MFLRLLVLCAALAATGCYATFAPPLRGTHSGAPGRLAAGEGELSAAVGGGGTTGALFPPLVVTPALGLALSEAATLEVGANLSTSELWTLIFLGPRFTFGPLRDFWFDVELGAGYGRGGSQGCFSPSGESAPTVCDALRPLERDAGGVYVGGGAAWRRSFFSAYVRARVEITGARRLPVTFWPSAVAGVELDLWRRVRLSGAAGYIGYVTSGDNRHGWIYQLEISVPFRLPGGRTR